MSGQSGVKGYLLQTIYGVFKSLTESNWDNITIEPNEVDEKVDVLWENQLKKKAVQVKSSINLITEPKLKKWAEELASSKHGCDDLELIVFGNPSKNAQKLKEYNDVKIFVKLLDIPALKAQCSVSLNQYLESKSYTNIPVVAREIIIDNLISNFNEFSTEGKKLKKEEFHSKLIELILNLSFSSLNEVEFKYKEKVENIRLKNDAINRAEATKFNLKFQACLDALKLVDDYLLIQPEMIGIIKDKFPEVEGKMKLPHPLDLGIRARDCHNRLIISCDNPEVIKRFLWITGIDKEEDEKITYDSVILFRNLVRDELGFGPLDSIAQNPDKAWIISIG